MHSVYLVTTTSTINADAVTLGDARSHLSMMRV